MTQVTVAETTYTVTVEDTNYTVTVADTTENIEVEISNSAADVQIITGGTGDSLLAGVAGSITTLKSITAGDNVTFSDDGSTITISATEDDLSNNTTDNLAEGLNNLYYTETRASEHITSYTGNIGSSGSGINTITGSTANFDTVNADLNAARIDSSGTNLTIDPNGFLHIDDTNVYVGSFTQAAHITDTEIKSIGNPLTITSGDIIPAANVTYTLGSPTRMWQDVYIGPGSLYIDGHKVLGSDETGQIDITTDDGQNLNIFAGANGPGGDIIVGSAGGVTTLQDATVNLGPSTQGGTINIRGTLEAADIHNGSLEFSGTVIDQTAPNQNLGIRTNGTGYLHANVSSMYVGSFSNYATITGSQITANLTGQVSDISNHSTDDLSEGSNLYYTDARVNTLLGTKGYATETYVDTEIANLVDSAPGTLDTLNELAAALGDDPNFATTVTNTLATKQDAADTATDARNAISLTSTNTAELSYDTATGVFSYVSPTTVTASNAVTLQVRNTTGASISKGSPVYISGHSGQNILISLADANASGQYPAIGLAAGTIANNSNGEVTVYGEIAGVDTSSYSVGDVLYLSETAGELTNVRPSASGTAIQNIGKVARADANGIIIIAGSGRANDVPNLASGEVFIGNGSGYEKRALDTDDVAEATNQYFTNLRAITAVENEATLDLTGDVTIANDLDVSGLIKISDGFTLSSFDPYAGSGLPSTAMPTTIMGAGQEEGWAALTVRSRGEHAWGLTGFGIPNEAPRALNVLQAGRLDGGSDDYLNSGDLFGQIMMNPYSAYRTGTEWLTPSVTIEAEATENHSSSGMGTKLRIRTTSNGSFAGATDSGHTDGEIVIQGTTLSTNGTLKLDDDVIITGLISNDGGDVVVDDTLKVNSTRVSASEVNTLIGDYTISAANYNAMGLRLNGGDDAWAIATFKEYQGDINSGKPINQFTNPGFATEVIGGTPANPAPLDSGKRVFAMTGTAANDSTGTVPGNANMRILGVTTETQSSTNRGTEIQFQTTSNGSSSTEQSMVIQGNQVIIGSNGDGIIKSSNGNLRLDDDVVVTGDLDVQGTISGVIHPFLLGGM